MGSVLTARDPLGLILIQKMLVMNVVLQMCLVGLPLPQGGKRGADPESQLVSPELLMEWISSWCSHSPKATSCSMCTTMFRSLHRQGYVELKLGKYK